MRVNISAVIILIDLAAIGVFNRQHIPVVSKLSELHIREYSAMFSFFKFRIILCDFFVESAPTFLCGFFRPCGQHVVSSLLVFDALRHTVSDKVTVLIVERILLPFRQDITSFLPCGNTNNTTETSIYPEIFSTFQRIEILQNIDDIILADAAVSDGSKMFTDVTGGVLTDTEQRTDFCHAEEIFSFLRTDLIGDSFDFNFVLMHRDTYPS